MKRFLSVMLVVALVFLLPLQVIARDTREMYSIEEALSTPEAKGKIDPGIKLFFGDAKHPGPVKVIGPIKTNRKTNASNKGDKEACQWVFLSAIIALQKAAGDKGGNAIIGIRSIYKNNSISSSTEFMCGAGALLAGVAFEGTIVQLP
jgi:hypothetical protein